VRGACFLDSPLHIVVATFGLEADYRLFLWVSYVIYILGGLITVSPNPTAS
jgi:hypothetical protein